MRRHLSTQTFAAVKLYGIRYFPNVNRYGSLNTKVAWLWVISFLVIISSYNTPFFLLIPHFLTSIKHCISFLHITKFLPASFYLLLHHLSSLIRYLFSLSLFMSPVYIWGTKCGTYRLSMKEDIVVASRLLLRLQKLRNVRYVMKRYSRMF
jgi:hypothetical protein